MSDEEVDEEHIRQIIEILGPLPVSLDQKRKRLVKYSKNNSMPLENN